MDYFPYFLFPFQDSLMKSKIINNPTYAKNINKEIINFKPYGNIPKQYSDFGMKDILDVNGAKVGQQLIQIEFN